MFARHGCGPGGFNGRVMLEGLGEIDCLSAYVPFVTLTILHALEEVTLCARRVVRARQHGPNLVAERSHRFTIDEPSKLHDALGMERVSGVAPLGSELGDGNRRIGEQAVEQGDVAIRRALEDGAGYDERYDR
jgi:hypothetical protein